MSGCCGSDFIVGQGLRLTGQFRDDAGRLTDPTTVYLRVKTPDGVIVTYVYLTDVALVRASTGVYYVDLDLEQDGCWSYTWGSTGAIQDVVDGTFSVRAPVA